MVSCETQFKNKPFLKPTQSKINVSHETCISQIVYVSCETSISKGENHGSKDYKKANNKETDRQKRD